jgi:hypothetical protein
MLCKSIMRERTIPHYTPPDMSKRETKQFWGTCNRDLRVPKIVFQGANETCDRLWCALKRSEHIQDVSTNQLFCPGSIWGYTQYCCHCLTTFDCKAKFDKFEIHTFDLGKDGCGQCQSRDTSWNWFGIMSSTTAYKPAENYKVVWYRLDAATGEIFPDDRAIPIEKRNPDVKPEHVVGLEFPKHLIQVPSWINKFLKLARVRINFCTLLPPAAARDLAVWVESIQSLECAGCTQLTDLPPNLLADKLLENAGVETIKILKPRASQ